MREYLNSFTKLEFDKVKKHLQRYTLSDLGREHIDTLTPSNDADIIRHRLHLVSEMKALLEGDDSPPFENIIDIRQIIQRASIEDFILPSDDLLKIALVLGTASRIATYFARRTERYPRLVQIVKRIHIEKIIEYNIRKAIGDDGKVRDDASRELLRIRRQILDRRDTLAKSLISILKSIAGKEWAQEEIITTREGRMVIPVKVEHKSRVSGFIHGESASGQTVYLEPTETLEVNNEIRTLESQEQREIERILRELSQQVRDGKESILSTLLALGEMDFIQAQAKYSIEIIGTEPQITSQGPVKLIGGFHPILLQRHKREHIQSLDMEFGGTIRTLIITGPNAGGKSVAMKTAGLLVLLAQAGCHIPASPETEIRIFSEIFVDMGDEQSIENDLSSFSSHLENLKSILEHAGNESLVLIDEIGSGTDPVEGASIAAAILEALTAKECATIVTTHHGSLKTFAFEHPHIENGGMEFDQATLKPTYRFRAGIPGSSYAIEMAERMMMPNEVIARSKELKGTQANKLEDLILDMERKSQRLQADLDAVTADRQTLKHSIEVYERKIKGLEKEIKLTKAQALDEATKIVDGANAAIEKAIREIKEESARRDVVSAARKDVERLRQDFITSRKEIESPQSIEKTEISIGSVVRLRQSNTEAEVVGKIDDENYVIVAGSMKLKTNIRELDVLHIKKNEIASLPERVLTTTEVRHEVDLRGMFGDEAIAAVDKLIDEAVLHGLHRIDVIHGKGTGALRKRVTEYLKGNAAVKGFRLGEWNEGGSGVTVVDLA